MELIDKSAIAAEIKRRIILLENNSDGIISMLASGMFVNEYKDLLSFLNTIEVKEVDKENKDMNEKIRQYLLWLVKQLWEDTINSVGLKKDDIIAWIEKKGK